MSRARTNRARRLATWAAATLLAVSTLASLVSRFCWIEWNAPTVFGTLGLRSGWLYAGNGGGLSVPGLHLLWPAAPYWTRPSAYALPNSAGGTNWYVRVPLWIPATVAAVLLGASCFAGRSARTRRRHRSLCEACAYDLTGITGPCPECGCEREHPS